jgi:hypothetical protein
MNAGADGGRGECADRVRDQGSGSGAEHDREADPAPAGGSTRKKACPGSCLHRRRASVSPGGTGRKLRVGTESARISCASDARLGRVRGGRTGGPRRPDLATPWRRRETGAGRSRRWPRERKARPGRRVAAGTRSADPSIPPPFARVRWSRLCRRPAARLGDWATGTRFGGRDLTCGGLGPSGKQQPNGRFRSATRHAPKGEWGEVHGDAGGGSSDPSFLAGVMLGAYAPFSPSVTSNSTVGPF